MSKNYKQISENILHNIGGKENVVSAAHCATRLRLVLKDDEKINVKEIEEMPAVKGSFNTSGQFQVILGSGVVDEVYKEFINLANIKEGSKDELKKEADKKDKSKAVSKLRQWVTELYKDKITADFMLDRMRTINTEFYNSLDMDNERGDKTIIYDVIQLHNLKY